MSLDQDSAEAIVSNLIQRGHGCHDCGRGNAVICGWMCQPPTDASGDGVNAWIPAGDSGSCEGCAYYSLRTTEGSLKDGDVWKDYYSFRSKHVHLCFALPNTVTMLIETAESRTAEKRGWLQAPLVRIAPLPPTAPRRCSMYRLVAREAVKP